MKIFICSVNNLLLALMKKQWDQLTCTSPSANFDLLQLIKSLYLLKCHGRQRYFHIQIHVLSGIFVNENYYSFHWIYSYERNCRQQSANDFTSRTMSGNFNMVVNQNGVFINGWVSHMISTENYCRIKIVCRSGFIFQTKCITLLARRWRANQWSSPLLIVRWISQHWYNMISKWEFLFCFDFLRRQRQSTDGSNPTLSRELHFGSNDNKKMYVNSI